jgi:hypothetical protein
MLMRRFMIFAMALAMSATAAQSSLRHRAARHHRAYRARTHAVSVRRHSTARTGPARTAHVRRTARLREVRYRRMQSARGSAWDRASSRSLDRVGFVPPLRGSRESLLRQNQRDDAEGLVRIQDQAQLLDLETSGDLVPIPVSIGLRVNPSLPPDRRYCRPWTARFLDALARSHYARFHRPIEIDSAVRTVSFQRHLELINGNAAPAEGDLASPHLSGAAIDIGKKRMSFSEISWMRGWLLPYQTGGRIDVEEEFHQACFHIDVYRSYDREPAAPARDSAASLIATGVN